MLGLLWECVDFKRGTINIDKQLQRGIGKDKVSHLVSTKNRKSRTITPAKAVMDMLKRHHAAQAQQRLNLEKVWDVFTNELGQP